MGFLTPKARLAFAQLKQAFVKAPIFYHFNPESHNRIEIDVLDYAIGGVLSQLFFGTRPDEIVTKTDFGQWHPIAFFSRKIILAKTWYKTYNDKLLAIVKIFKIWQYYLEDCKHEVFILTDHNNVCCFMDTKYLSFRQVCWTKELSCYHFYINYWQNKANRAADILL